jgi:hypothetical protein
MPGLLVATVVLLIAGILSNMDTEIVRSVVHKRRVGRDGLGGTQDIALWGTLVFVPLFVVANVCLGIEIWQSGGRPRFSR